MPTADNPDFQTTVTVTFTPPTADNPDWQQTITGPGGVPVGGGGYASLTGPGQSATPGELDQAGAFQAFDTTPGGSSMLLDTVNGIELIDNSSTGIVLQESTGPIAIQAQTGSSGVTIDSESAETFIGGAGVNIQAGAPGVLSHFLFTGESGINGTVGFVITDGISLGATATQYAWAFGTDGHIYFTNNSGTSWSTVI